MIVRVSGINQNPCAKSDAGVPSAVVDAVRSGFGLNLPEFSCQETFWDDEKTLTNPRETGTLLDYEEHIQTGAASVLSGSSTASKHAPDSADHLRGEYQTPSGAESRRAYGVSGVSSL